MRQSAAWVRLWPSRAAASPGRSRARPAPSGGKIRMLRIRVGSWSFLTDSDPSIFFTGSESFPMDPDTFCFNNIFFYKGQVFFIKIFCKNKISSENFYYYYFTLFFILAWTGNGKREKTEIDFNGLRHRPLKVFLRGKKLVYRSLKRMIQIRIVENIWIPNTKLLICSRRSTGTGTFELTSNFQYSRGGDVW